MILLIDNYDSFSYNLYQLAGAVNPDILVIRNDAYTVQQIEELHPEAIIISPGPGRPADAGVCIDVIRQLAGKVPMLGVCLGHQAICEAFGGTVSYAKELMHGKQSEVTFEADSVLFAGMTSPVPVARYHSLAAIEATLPKELRITARADDGEIMAVEHTEYPIYGVQFHPESVMTPDGLQIMKNFMEVVHHD
jgi:anthranilate synthase component 2